MDALLQVIVERLIALWKRVSSGHRADETWSRVAENLGLACSGTGFGKDLRLSGTLDGVPIEAEIFEHVERKKNKDEATLHTRYSVQLTGVWFRMTIQPVRPTGRRRYHAVTRTILTGDGPFDRAFCVRGDDPEVLTAYCDEERRAAIRVFHRRRRGTKITSEAIVNEVGFLEDNALRMTRTLHALVELARAMMKDIGNEEPAGEKPAVEKPAAVEPAEKPAPEPTEVLVPVPRVARDDQVVSSKESDDLTVAAVAETLFGNGVSSFDAKQRFVDEFAGKRVRWSGVLEQVESFGSDVHFGGTPGTRVTLHLVPSEGTPSGTVSVVAGLPPEEAERLRDARGQRMEGSGRLIDCDPFLRRLFVGE